MPADKWATKDGRPRGAAMTVGAGGAISFTSDSTKASKIPKPATNLRAGKKQKKCRGTFLPRTACWLVAPRWLQRQPIEGLAKEPIEVVQANPIPGSELNCDEEATLSRHPPCCGTKPSFRAARYLAPDKRKWR